MFRLQVSILFTLSIILLMACGRTAKNDQNTLPEFNPQKYLCYYTAEPLLIDGKMDEKSWLAAPETNNFVDIEGSKKPLPTWNTKARMLWDSTYLYIYAWMDEPHVNATLRQHDTVVYYDNDFEIFIDPNSDGHEYYELEINAFGTIWDLFLNRPYRSNNAAVDHWNISGLKTAVHIDGTINNATDTDKGWGVEFAIPWDALQEFAYSKTPPADGKQWRMNFSRVEWKYDQQGTQYCKTINPETGKAFPENNWVWSPQGVIAMHQPETWGIVQFSTVPAGEGRAEWNHNDSYYAAFALYNVFYAQESFFSKNKEYSNDWQNLNVPDFKPSGYNWPPQMVRTFSGFEACLKPQENLPTLIINQEGRIITKK